MNELESRPRHSPDPFRSASGKGGIDWSEATTASTTTRRGPQDASPAAARRVLGSTTRGDLLYAPRVVRLSPSERVARILTLLTITTESTSPTTGLPIQTPADFFLYFDVSAWLAYLHLNQPALHILPDIRQRLQSCDLRFSLDMRDDQFSPMHAAREEYRVFSSETTTTSGGNNNNSSSSEVAQQLLPLALLGAVRSAVSTSLSLLNLSYRMTQISSCSTASTFDNKAIYPYFARTVATNAGDARAAALYFQSLGVSKVGVLYYGDDFGSQYHDFFLHEASIRNIQVLSVLYADGGDKGAIQVLAHSGFRYFLGIFNPDTWESIVSVAAQFSIMGTPGYTWLLSESSSPLIDPSFQLQRSTESDIAKALNGVGVILIHIPNYEPFDTSLQLFRANATQKEQYVRQHHDPTIFDGYGFPPIGMSPYQYLTYDAMIALAVAACEVPLDAFSGLDLYKQLLQTSFEGVSGFVAFDNDTGTRSSEFFLYEINNLALSDNLSSADVIRFAAQRAVIVDQRNASAPVRNLVPFIFADNTTNIPLPLPPLTVDVNLIPTGCRAAGLSLGGLVMTTSLTWFAWTFAQRKKNVVKASQPLFLGQLCIGTFLLASSVVPMSLQEPVSQRGLDIACMATPWLISLGFVTAFSALFSKTWRLNRLLLSGNTFRRVKVRPQDVMLPFFVLMTLNIIFLILWTALSPLHWERSPMNDFDKFGRSVSSYGSCKRGSGPLASVFTALIFLVDFSALAFANYQAYKARNLPTDFNESFYIAISMAFLMEILLLGLPLAFLASQNPTTTFIIRSLLVSISGLAIQLPVFLPKFAQQHYGVGKVSVQHSGVSTVATIRKAAASRASQSQSHSQRDGTPSYEDSDFSERSSMSGIGVTRVKRNQAHNSQRPSLNRNRLSPTSPPPPKASLRRYGSDEPPPTLRTIPGQVRRTMSLSDTSNPVKRSSVRFVDPFEKASPDAGVASSAQGGAVATDNLDGSCTGLSSTMRSDDDSASGPLTLTLHPVEKHAESCFTDQHHHYESSGPYQVTRLDLPPCAAVKEEEQEFYFL